MRRPRGFNYSNSDDGGLIDLTPLLDVLFVILILFILAAPLLDVDHLALAPGKSSETIISELKNNQPIRIVVESDESISINGSKVSSKELSTKLRALYQQFPKEIPQLMQDKKASFGAYQNVKNLVELSGFDQMDVILEGN